jgi:hypothetical protein
LADIYEVFRALANVEGIPLDQVIAKADEKKRQAGGFDEGLVLLQTGILGRDRLVRQHNDCPLTHVLARRTSRDSYEIPFSFFGFMEFDQVRSLIFDDLGILVDVLLKTDRLEVRLSRKPEQLELPLDQIVDLSDLYEDASV